MPTAIVLLSGGLDSTTVLAIARDEGFEPCALSFDYGQRHKHELESAGASPGLRVSPRTTWCGSTCARSVVPR
jgi:hypothetical protein